MFRVLARLGIIHSVRARVCTLGSERVQRRKWDDYLGRIASKWERALSTRNEGASVGVYSAFERLQYEHSERSNSSHRGTSAIQRTTRFPLQRSRHARSADRRP